jgi:hypothetical protein
MANNHCLLSCPFEENHENFSSHASQSGGLSGNFIFDYCSVRCKYIKFTNPSLLISSPWIRPEDVGVYEGIRIDTIKLVDRRLQTPDLLRIINAYVKSEYNGSLIDLFPTLTGNRHKLSRTTFTKIKHILHHFYPRNILSIIKMKELLDNPAVFLDNSKLEGFIDFFISHDCGLVDCNACGYCKSIADKALVIRGDYIQDLKREYEICLSRYLSK